MNKFFLKSKTIWGVIVAVTPILVPALSVVELNNLAQAFMSLAGAALAVYGRIKAKDGLSF
jgi:hypothetical protein